MEAEYADGTFGCNCLCGPRPVVDECPCDSSNGFMSFAPDLSHVSAPVLKRHLGRVLDALLPPRCLKCGEVVAAMGALCPACWQQLSFLEPPCCACCGQPFDFDLGPDALCGACTQAPPAFD